MNEICKYLIKLKLELLEILGDKSLKINEKLQIELDLMNIDIYFKMNGCN